MPSIGGENFLTLRGRPDLLTERVERFTRPGRDGASFRLRGRRAARFRLVGFVDVDDAPAAQSRMDTLSALQGTLVTVETDHGVSHANVMVLQVRELARGPLLVSAGGLSETAGYFLRVAFEVELTENPEAAP